MKHFGSTRSSVAFSTPEAGNGKFVVHKAGESRTAPLRDFDASVETLPAGTLEERTVATVHAYEFVELLRTLSLDDLATLAYQNKGLRASVGRSLLTRSALREARRQGLGNLWMICVLLSDQPLAKRAKEYEESHEKDPETCEGLRQILAEFLIDAYVSQPAAFTDALGKWHAMVEVDEQGRETRGVVMQLGSEVRASMVKIDRAVRARGVERNPFAGASKPTVAFFGRTVDLYRAWGGYQHKKHGFQGPVKNVGEDIEEWVAVAKAEFTSRGSGMTSDELHKHLIRVGMIVIAFSAAWAVAGFPIIEPTHRLAASLMATWMPPEHVPELKAPWESFLLKIPDGLLPDSTFPSAPGELEVVKKPPTFVGLVATKEVTLLCLFDGTTAMNWCEEIPNLSALVAEEGAAERFPMILEALGGNVAVLELILRLTVGALVELDRVEHKVALAEGRPTPIVATTAGQEKGKSRGKGALPSTWNYVLRRDVVVDAREWVTDYAQGAGKGKRKSRGLGVQILVRGHHKCARCGKGRALRRWVHVEPYWRGPEDVPIAVRSHVLIG